MPHCTAAAAPLVVGKALRALLLHITCKGDAAHSGKEQPSSATGKLKAESSHHIVKGRRQQVVRGRCTMRSTLSILCGQIRDKLVQG